MPELPEVETTRRGIAPHLEGVRIRQLRVHDARLRWPVPTELPETLEGQTVIAVERRGKYLLTQFATGTLLIHLGMSGSLRLITDNSPRMKHDHIEMVLENGKLLRYNDPRRFGAWLWAEHWQVHPLLANLGPEPLSPEFDGAYLYNRARGRSSAIKPFLMDSQVVVGVGNIYANEALHIARIDPRRPAGRISLARITLLAEAAKSVLDKAIHQGGTTLRDFVNSDGKPGYFSQSLQVYGRGGQACYRCGHTLAEIRLGQRSTVFCKQCQT
ncbi:bifunctional DNA-formamidopyrimidine glycosylase/DNA-(apurinic or apyrimidinic site) lyase [Mangrovitalea sediminis]|uniref:bifunctional DNA-formamidopyrimidine glycosylase/DNA-(apurinic or apyrimidinic site) lyase n=1 Tax=Mangrovitalea sediminis TaxID=1982043 RepID=UPI000BE5F992|nr:bifunctional DNA-formamidopyrimidine glycosylase/DNA-(apurinic or apyrimidinic site) lyase [Mangrovitalea sediminis]